MADIAPLGFERFPIWENPIPVPRSDQAQPAPTPRIAEPVEVSTSSPPLRPRTSRHGVEKRQTVPEGGSEHGVRARTSGGMEALYPISAETGRVLLELQETSHRETWLKPFVPQP